MAATQSLTGKAGSLTVGGTTIPITKATRKLTVEWAKSTDSNNYDAASGTIWTSQLAGEQQIELALEGLYDKSTTSAQLISRIKAPGTGPFAITATIDGTNVDVNGNFDLTDFEETVEIPGATMVTWTCNAKSNGKPTLA